MCSASLSGTFLILAYATMYFFGTPFDVSIIWISAIFIFSFFAVSSILFFSPTKRGVASFLSVASRAACKIL